MNHWMWLNPPLITAYQRSLSEKFKTALSCRTTPFFQESLSVCFLVQETLLMCPFVPGSRHVHLFWLKSYNIIALLSHCVHLFCVCVSCLDVMYVTKKTYVPPSNTTSNWEKTFSCTVETQDPEKLSLVGNNTYCMLTNSICLIQQKHSQCQTNHGVSHLDPFNFPERV